MDLAMLPITAADPKMDLNYHILYFSSMFPTPLNPQRGVFSLNRVKALRQAGCDVTVYQSH